MNEAKFFVGRRKELAKLQKPYSNKSHVLITGEAGVGKTALLRQARLCFQLLFCDDASSLGRVCENFEGQFGWSHRKMNVIERKNRLLPYLARRAVPVALDSVALTPPRLAMLWATFWTLVLGFIISSVLQVFVSKEQMSRAFGQTNLKSVSLATGLGAASSSCSYAAVAAARSAIQQSAALIPALAFMFASTNLVIELGAVLWILMGWQFVLTEIFGAFVAYRNHVVNDTIVFT